MGNLGLRNISLIAILTSAMMVGGCAALPVATPQAEQPPQPSQSSLPTLISVDEVPESTRRAIEEFPEALPEDVSWSSAPILAGARDENILLEPGTVDVALADYWLCAWMADYVGAADAADHGRADAAISQLDKYVSLPAIRAHHQNPETFISSVIQPAKAGDAAKLREFFTTCRSLNASPDGTTTLTNMVAKSVDQP